MKKHTKPRKTLVFLTCVLAVPTVACLMYGFPKNADWQTFSPLLSCGCVLGLAHLLLRPLLRMLTLPLGCLTLGLSGTVIDIALIYLSAKFVKGFYVPGFLYALLTAMLINAVCGFVGARKN